VSGAHLSVVLATTNPGKLSELRSLLDGLAIEVLSLADVLPNRPPVVEDGATFVENALLKARAAAEASKLVAIADDSGLEVDALGGRPGVRSARFAKEGATDAENNAALLAALEHVEDDHRQARFHCVMVLVDPWAGEGEGEPQPPSSARANGDSRPPSAAGARPIVTEGRCEGTIGREAKGAGGFGYDPLFVVEGYGRTMAELDEAEKNLISHRGKAARAMRAALEALLAKRLESARRIMGGDSAVPGASRRTGRNEPPGGAG
jgi:XTP/dITP diphosphohydrolase